MKIKKNILSIIAFFCLSFLLFAFTGIGNTSKTGEKKSGVIYFVRHAEKVKSGDDDPVLTVYGAQRAKEMAVYLSDKNITAIYSTDFIRTKNTVAPLATKLAIEIELYDKNKTEALMKKILEKGGNQLVVGHWNTGNDAFSYFKVTPEYDTEEANMNKNILKVRYSENKLLEVVLVNY